MKKYFKALTIAGSDSGGGAGIQADLKTFSALGCYGMSVITAITAQNTMEVTEVHAVPESVVVKQLEAILADIGTDAVKIGMLHSKENIVAIANTLKKYEVTNIVLDPVMISKSGHRLLNEDAIDALKKYLIPIADIITPNLPEAEVLIGKSITTIADMERAVKRLAELGSKSVLLKGGHLEGLECTDLFYEVGGQNIKQLKFKRITTNNNHGTGCTLSSAIAANLASDISLEEAVVLAKSYINIALDSGKDYKLGSGFGPVHHFYNFWENMNER